MTYKELKENIAADYNRMLQIRGGICGGCSSTLRLT